MQKKNSIAFILAHLWHVRGMHVNSLGEGHRKRKAIELNMQFIGLQWLNVGQNILVLTLSYKISAAAKKEEETKIEPIYCISVWWTFKVKRQFIFYRKY